MRLLVCIPTTLSDGRYLVQEIIVSSLRSNSFIYKKNSTFVASEYKLNKKIIDTMIKMFVMQTCPYCEYVEKQVEGNPHFEVIDIGKHVRNLKQFLDLRDNHPAFDEAKKIGDVGIPCYVLEDGTVTLSSKDAGLEPMPDENTGASCSIDGSGC